MNEFEIAVVNEPSVLEPLKFYCISRIAFLYLVDTVGLQSSVSLQTKLGLEEGQGHCKRIILLCQATVVKKVDERSF